MALYPLSRDYIGLYRSFIGNIWDGGFGVLGCGTDGKWTLLHCLGLGFWVFYGDYIGVLSPVMELQMQKRNMKWTLGLCCGLGLVLHPSCF